MYRMAIYGKGGIGKSTTTCNLSASLAAQGFTVMQVGCDPKSDSTRLLMDGWRIPTVLDQLRAGGSLTLDDVVFESPSGVMCVEAGGPLPGVGCAGRGVITAFEQLSALSVFDVYQPDFVFYDVLGDVVCGGFAMPLRAEYAQEVLVVTSGEMMSLYAASNIIKALDNFKNRNYARLAGIVANLRGVQDEAETLERFSREENVPIVAEIPRSSQVQQADAEGRLVMEASPECDASAVYRQLAAFVQARAKA